MEYLYGNQALEMMHRMREGCHARQGNGGGDPDGSNAHNAPALSHTTWTNKADNWLCSMASMNGAHLWCIPMSYGWATDYGIAMDKDGPGKGVTMWNGWAEDMDVLCMMGQLHL